MEEGEGEEVFLLLGIKANWQCTTLVFPYNNDERRRINKEKWLHQATALSTGHTKEKSRPRWGEIDFALKKKDHESIFCAGENLFGAQIYGETAIVVNAISSFLYRASPLVPYFIKVVKKSESAKFLSSFSGKVLSAASVFE